MAPPCHAAVPELGGTLPPPASPNRIDSSGDPDRFTKLDGLTGYCRVQNVRIEIGSTRPTDGSYFWVYSHFRYFRRLFQRRKDSLEVYDFRKIYLPFDTIFEL